MTWPLTCAYNANVVHGELWTLGREAAELAIAEAQRMELPMESARDLVAAAVTQAVIEAYTAKDHPKLAATIDELHRHARQRIEELIREQQAGDHTATPPS